jgi:hypothetical protein
MMELRREGRAPQVSSLTVNDLHRCFEELERELVSRRRATPDAVRAAVRRKMTRDPHEIATVGLDLDLPAEQSEPDEQNRCLFPAGGHAVSWIWGSS